ncbi:hypothetical protein [Candidatus Hodarchaeum mangrovi]
MLNSAFHEQFASLLKRIYQDKVLLLAIVTLIIISLGNFYNKLFLDFEPLQYSIFSYDKSQHFLASIILVRCFYWVIDNNQSNITIKNKLIYSAGLALGIYGLIWEPFELLTFIFQDNLRDQFILELMDVPLDWIYDILGVLVSHLLGYRTF